MAPPKASVHFDDSSDSDSDGPEALPLSQAKRHAKEHQTSVASTLAKRKEEQRDKNRKRDEQLKAQAGKRKEAERAELAFDEDDEEDDDDMGDFIVEDEQEEDSSGEDDFVSFDDAGMASSDAEADPEADEDEDEDLLSEETTNTKLSLPNPKHLPDHLFTAAFSQPPLPTATSLKPTKRKQQDLNDEDLPKKRHRKRKNPHKDVSLGSRTFRTLPKSSVIGARPGAASGLRPPAKARQFLDRTLALKAAPPVVSTSGTSGAAKPPNRNDRARSWQRRPANIGVMRPSIHGPAASFVRNV